MSTCSAKLPALGRMASSARRGTSSFTCEDIEIGDYVVPRDRILSLSTLSAMRDPALYADPDSFNIRRTDHPRRHLVFGAGVHRCLGEALARRPVDNRLREPRRAPEPGKLRQ
jgi:cytochrome P450